MHMALILVNIISIFVNCLHKSKLLTIRTIIDIILCECIYNVLFTFYIHMVILFMIAQVMPYGAIGWCIILCTISSIIYEFTKQELTDRTAKTFYYLFLNVAVCFLFVVSYILCSFAYRLELIFFVLPSNIMDVLGLKLFGKSTGVFMMQYIKFSYKQLCIFNLIPIDLPDDMPYLDTII